MTKKNPSFKARLQSKSPEETGLFAEEIAQRILSAPLLHCAKVIGFSGDLGAGKTTFIQGFMRGLSIRSHITSPTFVLLKRYPVPHTNHVCVFHIDAYRLHSFSDLIPLDIESILCNPKNIVLIEWIENIKNPSLPICGLITFTHGKKEFSRTITASLSL